MRRAFVSACAAALIVTFTAAGCTTSTSERPGPAQPQRDTAAKSSRSEGRELTDAERVLVQRAEQLLIKECMEGEGFKYWVGPLPTVDDLKGGGYVLTDADWAKRHGYGSRLEEKLQDAQRSDPNHAYANGLPQKERVRYGKTLEGGPSGGMLTAELPGGGTVQTPRHSCLSKAKEQLYGDFETWFRAEKTTTNLTDLYVPDLLEDKRFVSALKEWSACMREAGHGYADPPEIRAELPELTKGLSPDASHAVEVKLAVDEAVCATKTPLSATAHALDEKYRDELRATYGDAIATYEHMSLAALDRAEDITGDMA
ncbi:hypothetical protein ACFS5L_12610 [Streptomyces phyllanthi]|uniref:Lipoprotein n=1 Tax=Streptomyces phyllanthi TaxID=1803180 RepID=A0A5N8WCY2_9ACTN|nr:hypothetical protein [Streptomyces phyllanthi]MPY44244.1 hypothetical protein [Streptomyces phyllanthi]